MSPTYAKIRYLDGQESSGAPYPTSAVKYGTRAAMGPMDHLNLDNPTTSSHGEALILGDTTNIPMISYPDNQQDSLDHQTTISGLFPRRPQEGIMY